MIDPILKHLTILIGLKIKQRLQEENMTLVNVEIFPDDTQYKSRMVGLFAFGETADGKEFGAEATISAFNPKIGYELINQQLKDIQLLLDSIVLGEATCQAVF